MINIKQVKKYCCEDIAAIENYEKALNDDTQTWEIHHRLEVQDDGTLISGKELIDNGLYWGRPACELIFLTKSDHTRLHKIGNTNMRGKKMSVEAKKKTRESMKKYWENKKKIEKNEKNGDQEIHAYEKNYCDINSVMLF